MARRSMNEDGTAVSASGSGAGARWTPASERADLACAAFAQTDDIWETELLPGLLLRRCPAYVHLTSERLLRVASTGPYGGGLRRVRDVLSLRADGRSECQRPERWIRERGRRMGISGPFVALLTGVSLERAKVAVRRASDVTAAAVVSAGGRNLSAAGLSPVWDGPEVGTINIIAVVDAALSDAALLNLLTVATEAKSLALRERGVMTEEGFSATGTSTDAVVVACTGRGPRLRYGGPITLPGHLVGAAVLTAARAALDGCSIGRGKP